MSYLFQLSLCCTLRVRTVLGSTQEGCACWRQKGDRVFGHKGRTWVAILYCTLHPQVEAVAAGREHAVVSTADGKVFTWGGRELLTGRAGDTKTPGLAEVGRVWDLGSLLLRRSDRE